MSGRYAKRKIKWLFSRLDTIPFSPWSLSIDVNCYILLDACIQVAYCSMRTSELTITHSESSVICLAIQNTQTDGKLDRNPA